MSILSGSLALINGAFLRLGNIVVDPTVDPTVDPQWTPYGPPKI